MPPQTPRIQRSLFARFMRNSLPPPAPQSRFADGRDSTRMPASEQPRDPRERPLTALPAGREEPQTARGVTDVRGLSRLTRCQPPGERPVVGLKVGAERAARLQKPGA